MSTEERSARQLVVFTLSGEQYAVPIKHVQEVIRHTQLRSVASTDTWVRGVLSLRGKIVPVCDLAACLGVNSELAEQTKVMILDTGSRTVGLSVDAVDEVLTIEEHQLDAAPGADTTLINAIAKVDERLVVLLDPDGIFASSALAA